MKRRAPYILLFIILTGIEVLIALFVHDSVIRPYGGDVIVVWVVYCFVQAILGGRNNHYITAAGVLIFAYAVEFLQKIHIVDLIGLGHIRFFRVLIGTGFEVIDLLCYTLGTAICMAGISLAGKHR